MVIGKKGADIEKARQELAKLTRADVHLNIVEILKPEIDAKLVAEGIAQQLERRVSTRRAMKRGGAVGDAAGRAGHPHQSVAAVSAAPRSPGRSGTGGAGAAAYLARARRLRPGAAARTTYGVCGVKV